MENLEVPLLKTLIHPPRVCVNMEEEYNVDGMEGERKPLMALRERKPLIAADGKIVGEICLFMAGKQDALPRHRRNANDFKLVEHKCSTLEDGDLEENKRWISKDGMAMDGKSWTAKDGSSTEYSFWTKEDEEEEEGECKPAVLHIHIRITTKWRPAVLRIRIHPLKCPVSKDGDVVVYNCRTRITYSDNHQMAYSDNHQMATCSTCAIL